MYITLLKVRVPAVYMFRFQKNRREEKRSGKRLVMKYAVVEWEARVEWEAVVEWEAPVERDPRQSQIPQWSWTPQWSQTFK